MATKTTRKSFREETVKAVYNRKTRAYDTVETIGFKATLYPATKKQTEHIIIACKGCYIECTEGEKNDKGKAMVKISARERSYARYDEDSKTFMEELDKSKYAAIKSFLLKKHGFSNMAWSTLKNKCK